MCISFIFPTRKIHGCTVSFIAVWLGSSLSGSDGRYQKGAFGVDNSWERTLGHNETATKCPREEVRYFERTGGMWGSCCNTLSSDKGNLDAVTATTRGLFDRSEGSFPLSACTCTRWIPKRQQHWHIPHIRPIVVLRVPPRVLVSEPCCHHKARPPPPPLRLAALDLLRAPPIENTHASLSTIASAGGVGLPACAISSPFTRRQPTIVAMGRPL